MTIWTWAIDLLLWTTVVAVGWVTILDMLNERKDE